MSVADAKDKLTTKQAAHLAFHLEAAPVDDHTTLVRLQDVWFKYHPPGGLAILRNVSLTVDPKSRVVVVGQWWSWDRMVRARARWYSCWWES